MIWLMVQAVLKCRRMGSFAGKPKQMARAGGAWFIRSPLPRYVPFLEYSYGWERPSAILLPAQKLLYVPVPKVANRSIKAALAAAAGLPFADGQEPNFETAPLAAVPHLTDYFRFTFVRHPLDRLLSCYAQKIVLYARQLQMPLLFWRYGRRFWPEMSFAEFVTAVAAIPDGRADRHFRSQHTFVYTGGRLAVDFVGRFEQLAQDWAQVQQQTGLGPLPHFNPSPHKPFTEMYTPMLAQLAAARYRQDLALFAYEVAAAG
jgi:hypothetical protein